MVSNAKKFYAPQVICFGIRFFWRETEALDRDLQPMRQENGYPETYRGVTHMQQSIVYPYYVPLGLWQKRINVQKCVHRVAFTEGELKGVVSFVNWI